VRALLYDPASSRRIPLLLRRAAGGDLAGLMAQAGAPPRVFADGLYLSITCSESFAHFPLAEAMRAAEATPFGSYRLARQAAACAHWPVAASEVPQPRGQLQTPVLFVAGEFDPVTPRAWAEDTKRQFPNSQILTLPGGGHGFPTGANVDTCLDPLLNRFLDSPDAGTLDASCIATMRPPPFATR
jgi:pimeloyl-ACP methyl ester carboxylesterase